ncbi:MAG: hypothetical protein KKA28_06305 [Planctomycetes bacterium]|nr:hypothetical protein [Planctomycetota bacterium]MCG2682623.1 hypothetical protein [Planctomycetales bacterium]
MRPNPRGNLSTGKGTGMTLEQELIDIFASTPSQRNREILIGYYGWEDGRQHTLTEVGARFGITRERVRQVCAKLTKRLKTAPVSAPIMDRVLKLISEMLPAPAARIEAELTGQGFTAVGMSLGTVAAAARLLDRPVEFEIVAVTSDNRPKTASAKRKGRATYNVTDGRLAVRPGQEKAVTAAIDLAKKEAYFHGLTTVERIERAIAGRGSEGKKGTGTFCAKYPQGRSGKMYLSPFSPLVRQTVALMEGFRWLDQSAGWFCLSSIQRHGLPKTIDKVLAVSGEVTGEQLHKALSRNRRLWKEPPPENVLLEFCRRMPGVRVEDDRIIADPPRDWKKSLTGVEAKLVAVLKKHGPLMERGEMEDLCVGGGMNRFSFHAFVSWSPVIAQFGHSVYGLLGTEVSPEQVEAVLARRRADRAERRVLDGHGRTADGKVWLQYRLSKAASTYAVITIPAALKKTVRGRFKFLDADGREIGTLATKDGRAWGLGAFLRKNGARIGDRIKLTLDLKNRTAAVTWEERGEE